MDRRCPLDVESRIILRQHVLAVGLLANLNIGDRVAALLQIGDFGRGVFWCLVEQRDGNHGRLPPRYSAGEKQIKSHLRLRGRTNIGRLMPGIHRRTVGRCLFLIGRVPDHVVKRAVFSAGSEIELADGVAHAIARIGGTVGIASIGRFRHPEAHEPYARDLPEADGFGSSLALFHFAEWKCLPNSACRPMYRVFSGPILHDIAPGIRLAPRNANAVHHLRLRQVHHHPLRMQRVALAGEALREIGIALPETVSIAVGQAGKANVLRAVVAGKTAAGQPVSIGVAYRLRRSGRTGEVPFSAGIAPRSARIPMPCFDSQFRVLPIGYSLPAGGKRFLERGLQQIFVNGFRRNPIHARAESLFGHKVIGRVA